MTEAEYLRFERAQTRQRHEFAGGTVTPRVPANLRHNRIQTRVMMALVDLAGPAGAEAFGVGLGIRTPSGSHRYPDAMVCPSPPHLMDEHEDVVLNPLAMVDTVSAETAQVDRTMKLAEYRTVPSLTDYILLD